MCPVYKIQMLSYVPTLQPREESQKTTTTTSMYLGVFAVLMLRLVLLVLEIILFCSVLPTRHVSWLRKQEK